MRNNKAITLIALVITIVILIILAGVLINLTLGDNGLFTRSKLAKQKYEYASAKEIVEVKLVDIQAECMTEGKEYTLAKISEEMTLEKQITIDTKYFKPTSLKKDGVSDSNESLKGIVVSANKYSQFKFLIGEKEEADKTLDIIAVTTEEVPETWTEGDLPTGFYEIETFEVVKLGKEIEKKETDKEQYNINVANITCEIDRDWQNDITNGSVDIIGNVGDNKSKIKKLYLVDEEENEIDITDTINDQSEFRYNIKNEGKYKIKIKNKKDVETEIGEINIVFEKDIEPPEDFTPRIKVRDKRIVISAETTDNNSGIDYYEFSIKKEEINEYEEIEQIEQNQNLRNNTIQVDSYGNYEILVSAKDKAGNIKNSTLVKLDLINSNTIGLQCVDAEQIFDFNSGRYKLECWGAQGGSYTDIYHGGYGGYSVGEIVLNTERTLYINVGGAGKFSTNALVEGRI